MKNQLSGKVNVIATSKSSLHLYRHIALNNAIKEGELSLGDAPRRIQKFSAAFFSDNRRIIPMVALQLIRRVR